MAVNLLSLAGSLSRSLHNTPTNRGRSKSYAPGTTYGNKIPGTSLRKGAGLTNLASKGRKGDTRIRKVKGQPSHVSATEANVIDRLGPLGAAWVERVGSGTINPKTGLKEYFNPFKGDWGFLGKTKARKARDRARASASARHATFEAFRRKYENENVAGIFTPDKADDGSKISSPYASAGESGFNQFVGDLSGLVTSEADIASSMAAQNTTYGKMASGEIGGGKFKGIGEKKFIDTSTTAGNMLFEANVAGKQAGQRMENTRDIQDYTDSYDTRTQDEALANYNRQGQQLGLKQESAFNADIANQKNVGSQLSSGLFGMLTQAQETQSQQNFAGAGNFAEKFQQKQAVKDAERQVNAGQTDREMQIQEIGIQREQAAADLATQTQDAQDDFNQEFWENMVSWDSAINA